MQQNEKQNVNEFVTEHFINDLKAGRIPWRRPWASGTVPFNPVTKLPYLGINQLLLASLGYPQNYFLTFKQIKDLGAKVKPGERAHSIVFWEKSETEGEKASLLTYPVFNISQCDELPGEFPELLPENPYQVCEKIIEGMPEMPKIAHADGDPRYDNATDVIFMPLFKTFKDRDQYFFTLFFEMVTATGNEKEQNRKEVTGVFAYDSRQYALRQLTAEIGAWQLANIAGIKIPPPGYSSRYIQYWIERLERDRFLVINAALSAQRAVNYILNYKKEDVVEEPSIDGNGEEIPGNDGVAINGEFFEPFKAEEPVKNEEESVTEPLGSPKSSKKKRHENQ